MTRSFKPSEFAYQSPPKFLPQAIEELKAIRDVDESKKSKLTDLWFKKYFKDYTERREVQMLNISNFSFLGTTYEMAKDEHKLVLERLLEDYAKHSGFLKREGKYVCDIRQAMALMDEYEASVVRVA